MALKLKPLQSRIQLFHQPEYFTSHESIVIKSAAFFIKLALVLFSLIAIGFLSIEAKEILSPLIFSLLIPLLYCHWSICLKKSSRLPGGLAAGLSVILFIAALVLLFYILGSQFARLGQDWPQFQQQIDITIKNLQQWVEKTRTLM